MLGRLYRLVVPDLHEMLRREFIDCDSILDLGCGRLSPIVPFTKGKYTVGVEKFLPYLKHAKKNKTHTKLLSLDVRSVYKKFKPKSFDCVVALDLIEHLPKKDGIIFRKHMEEIAKKKVIIFTPNGFLPQKPYDNNKFQEHVSAWNVQEMRKQGYRVYGINGMLGLRAELSEIKWKPRAFWFGISELTQILTFYCPKIAFQIFCVKTLKKK